MSEVWLIVECAKMELGKFGFSVWALDFWQNNTWRRRRRWQVVFRQWNVLNGAHLWGNAERIVSCSQLWWILGIYAKQSPKWAGRADFCKPFESVLFCFLSLSEHASRTFIHYEKIMHALGQKTGHWSNWCLQRKSCTWSAYSVGRTGRIFPSVETPPSDGCVQVLLAGLTQHRRPFPGGAVASPAQHSMAGLTVCGRFCVQAGIRQGGSGHHWKHLGVRAAVIPRGEGLGRGHLFPTQQPRGTCCWEAAPALLRQQWQQFGHLSTGPEQARSFLSVKEMLMRNFSLFSPFY